MESPQGNMFVFFNLAETGVKHSKKNKKTGLWSLWLCGLFFGASSPCVNFD